MALFRRGTSASRDSESSESDERSLDVDSESLENDAPTEDSPVGALTSRASGPLDVTEADSMEGYLDLGALRIRPIPGMELRIEVDETSEQIVGLSALLDGSAVQLQAFAAPKSGGLWLEIREEIADEISRQGGSVDEQDGPWGVQLNTRIPSAMPDGTTGYAPARFIGVDGPRWFLRAVLSGPVANDEADGSALLDVVRSCVVVRGSDPMAPRELLPLRLPEETADPHSEDDDEDPLDPFTRGPELTETR